EVRLLAASPLVHVALVDHLERHGLQGSDQLVVNRARDRHRAASLSDGGGSARATISARSRTSISSSLSKCLTPSTSMVLQNGHATATASTLASTFSRVLFTLTCFSGSSSVLLRAAPAPQQKPCSRFRRSST